MARLFRSRSGGPVAWPPTLQGARAAICSRRYTRDCTRMGHACRCRGGCEAGWCDQDAADQLAARRRHDWGLHRPSAFPPCANPQAGAHLGWLPPSAAAPRGGLCRGISVLSPPEVRQRTRPSDPPAYPRVPQCRSQDSHQKRMTLARAMHNVAQGRLTSFGAKAPVDGPTDAMKRWQATRSGLALRV